MVELKKIKPLIQYYWDGSRHIYMQGTKKAPDGSCFVPEYYDYPLPGIFNKLKRLLNIGGYERLNVHDTLKERFAKSRMTS